MQLSARQDLFHGVVRHVPSVNRLRVTIELPFDIAVTRIVTLEEVRHTDFDSDDLRDRAQHCLIVLLGGKSVVVAPSPSGLDRWTSKPTLARVYLNERLYGQPVGFTPELPGCTRPVLEVSSFFNSLRAHGFQVGDVKQVINGGRERGRTS